MRHEDFGSQCHPSVSATFTALNDVQLDVRSGELLALLGPSGLGQDDAAADYRGAGLAGRGRGAVRRRGRAVAHGRASATSVSCSSTTRCSGT